jgi:DNA-binding transcriptional LysR family regulator
VRIIHAPAAAITGAADTASIAAATARTPAAEAAATVIRWSAYTRGRRCRGTTVAMWVSMLTLASGVKMPIHAVASAASLAATIFPPLIAALAAEPLEVICRTAHSHEVAEQLADGAAHVGFLLGTAVPEGITARPLYKVPVVAIAPPTRVCWVSPADTALTLAAEHGYIAMLPADTAHPGLRSGALAQVKITNLPRWSMNVAVAYRHGFAEQQAPKIMQILAATGTKIAGGTR